MHRRGVALFAGDKGDAHPPLDPAGPSSLHGVRLGRMAVPLIDAAEVDGLAALCAELGRYSFMLTVAHPRSDRCSVNPTAVF